jgi:hypothetical protein
MAVEEEHTMAVEEHNMASRLLVVWRERVCSGERSSCSKKREREGCCRELHAWREETFFRWPVAARDSYQDILGP